MKTLPLQITKGDIDYILFNYKKYSVNDNDIDYYFTLRYIEGGQLGTLPYVNLQTLKMIEDYLQEVGIDLDNEDQVLYSYLYDDGITLVQLRVMYIG